MTFTAQGVNGDNLNLGKSGSLGLSYLSSSSKQIIINGLSNPLYIIIEQGSDLEVPEYVLANVTNYTNSMNFAWYGFTLNGSNVSIHVQIKPEDEDMKYSKGYIGALKFGSSASFLTPVQLDLWELYCPKG